MSAWRGYSPLVYSNVNKVLLWRHLIDIVKENVLSNLDRPEIISGNNLRAEMMSLRGRRNFTCWLQCQCLHAYFQPVLPDGLYSRCWSCLASPIPTPTFHNNLNQFLELNLSIYLAIQLLFAWYYRLLWPPSHWTEKKLCHHSPIKRIFSSFSLFLSLCSLD